MNFQGLIIGALCFAAIGLFHPIVIKVEYYWGTQSWWLFALLGIACIVCSLLLQGTVLPILLGIVGFCCFWSILELFKQRERVQKGWFPENPKRKHKDNQ